MGRCEVVEAVVLVPADSVGGSFLGLSLSRVRFLATASRRWRRRRLEIRSSLALSRPVVACLQRRHRVRGGEVPSVSLLFRSPSPPARRLSMVTGSSFCWFKAAEMVVGFVQTGWMGLHRASLSSGGRRRRLKSHDPENLGLSPGRWASISTPFKAGGRWSVSRSR